MTEHPRLLLLFAPADHPHRDPVTATLAWMAAGTGRRFECYFGAIAGGTHFGGGHPAGLPDADLRGGTLHDGHHLEQLYRVLTDFRCEAACLGEGPFDGVLRDAGIPILSRRGDVAGFYAEVVSALHVPDSHDLLVVGDGGRPQGVPLTAYAYPEIVNRRLLAIASGDAPALAALRAGRSVHALWPSADAPGDAAVVPAPAHASVALQTGWMARRWEGWATGHLLGDPELVGRWTPTAVRERWTPLFGIPQSEAIVAMEDSVARRRVMWGRQQDDRDFLELSRLGTAFQLIDPGRPAFPVVRTAARPQSAPPPTTAEDPDDDELERWARSGRVAVSLLFWTGMVRELENLYAVGDALALSGLAAGLVLTTESFLHMPHPPLSLLGVRRSAGGLAPRVEALLASVGAGAVLESAAPQERVRDTLRSSVDELAAVWGREWVPAGWWGVMDPELRPVPAPRLSRQPDAPWLKVRYRGRGGGAPSEPVEVREHEPRPAPGPALRALVRRSALRHLMEPLRPFDGFAPGPPGLGVLSAVRDAGFTYAFTKAGFGGDPKVVDGVPELTALTYTVGRWDGWTPFATVNSLGDLRSAERRLRRRRRPGWLVGTLDTCLWAFSGPRWERGQRLLELCRWAARGGDSGELINVPPRVVARYARLLAERGLVDRLPAA